MAKQLRHEKRDEAVDDEADDAQSTAHGHGTRAVIAALLANLAHKRWHATGRLPVDRFRGFPVLPVGQGRRTQA